MPRTLSLRFFWLPLLLVASAAPARAGTTLMVLVDWWLQQPMDTIKDLKVFQSTSEIKMVDGSAVPQPIATDAYTTEKFSWWYALPDFNADAYVQGRIRFSTLYQRGWFQNDSTYRALAGDTVFLPDTQTTFTYINLVNSVIHTVPILGPAPKYFVFDSAGSYRGRKVYYSAGNAGTELLNQRTLGAGGLPVSGTGRLDKCIDSLKSDTVWLRWGTPTSPPGQQPTAAKMKCLDRNPFLGATTSVRSPVPSLPSSATSRLEIDRNLHLLLPGKTDPLGRQSIPSPR